MGVGEGTFILAGVGAYMAMLLQPRGTLDLAPLFDTSGPLTHADSLRVLSVGVSAFVGSTCITSQGP